MEQKPNKQGISIDDVLTELEKRYPNELPMKKRSDFEQGIDVGYQLIINEMKEMLEFGVDEERG